MQSLTARVRVAVFLSFLAATPLAFAAEPWEIGAPLSADPKAMLAAAERIPAGESDAVILLDETQHVFDEQGRGVTTQRFIYRIVAESAVDAFGSINASWAPWVQEKPVLAARVITRDGTVHNLDTNAVVEAPAPEQSLDIFSDNRVIRAPLPAIAVGSVVEQLISYKSKESLYDAATSDLFFFGSYKPVHKARFVVDAPASLALTWVNETAPRIEPRREQHDGRQRYVFEAGPLAAKDDIEWDLPYDVAPLPYVGVSTAKSWQELARRYHEIVDRQIGSGSLDKIVREAIGNATDRKEVVARALAWIQKRVRYAGVEIGESSVVPRSPQTVLGNRYGDCKDKATLLVAMLRHAGLKAHVALLRAGHDFDVPRDLPGLGMFNHAIVVVDGDTPLWVDPTDEFSRAGELPIMDQGRMALVASTSTTSLTQTPVAESSANRIFETRTFTLPEEGKATVVEVTEPSGADESMMRRYYISADRKRYREQMEQYAKGYYAAKGVKKIDAADAHDLTKPFRLSVEIEESQRGQAMDGEAAVAVIPSGLMGGLPWSLQNLDFDEETDKPRKPRRNDFLFSRPFVKEWQYRIVPPQGFVARTLPENETKKLGTATVSRSFSSEPNGTVVATFRFDTGKRRLSPSEFEEVRKALKELDRQGAVMLGFDQLGQLELNNGNISAALTEFRKLAAAHSKEGRHQVEIARALLAGGMGEAAREQIKKAIALEPSYARAHRMLGVILQHDIFGRPFRKGFDLAGAIAAYRKAKELDPKDHAIRAELAKLLTYGEEGVLFGRNARLKDAIAEYEALIKEEDREEYKGELYRALAHSGRFDELKDALADAPNPATRTLWNVVIAAIQENSAAAIRAARAEEQSDRKEILGNAGALLLSLRRYGAAADLVEEAHKGSPSTETRSHIENIRKARRIEELEFPASDPKSVVRRFVIASTLGELDGDGAAAKFFVNDAKKLVEDRGEFRMERINVTSIARQQGLPLAFYADVAIGTSTFVQDGDDATGYRVRMRAAGNAQNETMFVVREGDEYRLTATRRAPAMIGWSVNRLIDANKLEAARTWLNWAREELPAGGGDDPLAGHPFTKIWPRGKQSATEGELRLAAALMLPSKELADEAIKALTAAREKAANEDEKTRIDQALVMAHAAKTDSVAMLAAAERLHNAVPESAFAFNARVGALTGLDRNDEIVKLANERLKRIERDDDAMRALAQAAMHTGDYASCDRYFRQILDESRPTAGDYNNVAWNALLSGKDLERALEDARAAMKLPGSGAALLHTVASLYAETGKSLEAREALLQSMDSAGREDPAPHDWYVLGRIAENYGAKDAALSAYKRVEKPKTTLASSTWLLAERRIKALK